MKYFKNLPVTILKIDKVFIDNILNSGYDQSLINAMINIAHFRDVEVVSEGVETPEQLKLLKASGCDTIQGFLFSKPLHQSDIKEYTDSFNK